MKLFGGGKLPAVPWWGTRFGSVSFLWAPRSWTFGIGFPNNKWFVIFIGPMIWWVGNETEGE